MRKIEFCFSSLSLCSSHSLIYRGDAEGAIKTRIKSSLQNMVKRYLRFKNQSDNKQLNKEYTQLDYDQFLKFKSPTIPTNFENLKLSQIGVFSCQR